MPEIVLDAATRKAGWYAAQVKPNALRIARTNLTRQKFEHFAPLLTVSTRSAHGMRTGERPLFPGYVFVRFDPAGDSWRAINATRGITRLVVSDPRRPRALPEGFIEGLRARCDGSGTLQEPDRIAVGDEIRILSGPFADIVARVEDLTSDQRLRLLIDLMGQATRVEVPASIVERAVR
ncbi:hypothetical protein ROJ8625_04018 [Roseivivax jejudonensis]|uniref:Transcription termination/antitermination protein NusG n=1 Tax=Roseivivax jejudonensis TaxID=1529041 RepID=A0A1X7A9Z6_9RHOB|nr:transcriptional activator RfaH [Roseivivax jejudonensis]SLN74165.1 hypothetical protein ROJ8625_04018 [Roseivivax jejudonensis]